MQMVRRVFPVIHRSDCTTVIQSIYRVCLFDFAERINVVKEMKRKELLIQSSK